MKFLFTPFLTLIFSVSLLFSSTGNAADTNSQFAMKGAGLLPCKIFITERDNQSNVYFLIAGWIDGYISSYNKLTENTFDILSFESLELILELIDQHCQSNASVQLYPIVNSMLSQWHEDRITESNTRVKITEGERETNLYRKTIERIQQKLKQKGLFKEEAGGVFTAETKDAIAAFQKSIGFKPTGFPDQSTLWKLLRST